MHRVVGNHGQYPLFVSDNLILDFSYVRVRCGNGELGCHVIGYRGLTQIMMDRFFYDLPSDVAQNWRVLFFGTDQQGVDIVARQQRIGLCATDVAADVYRWRRHELMCLPLGPDAAGQFLKQGIFDLCQGLALD